jgi:hypothetical protein
LLLNVQALCVGSPPQDDERRLWDSEFLKKRQAAKSSSPRKQVAYRRATPKLAASTEKSAASVEKPAASTEKPSAPGDKKSAQGETLVAAKEKSTDAAENTPGEMLGVTIWRLRPSTAADAQDARLLLEEDKQKSSSTEFTPERVEVETTFGPGDRVRLSIESPRAGYLYVIDREQYADGSVSDPYLIFPTLRNRGGNNAVSAGQVVELPQNNVFKLTPMRDDYKGEIITLLVTGEPLLEITAGPGIQKLDSRMVAQWEKQWSAAAERFELVGGAGKSYTRVEKEAGSQGRILTQEDDLPQTLYRVIAKPGNPILVSLLLKISR